MRAGGPSYGYGYIHGPSVRSHQSTSAGSFGLVRPAWIRYTRSAVPQDVERRAIQICAAPLGAFEDDLCADVHGFAAERVRLPERRSEGRPPSAVLFIYSSRPPIACMLLLCCVHAISTSFLISTTNCRSFVHTTTCLQLVSFASAGCESPSMLERLRPWPLFLPLSV